MPVDPELLSIVKYPDPVLRRKAAPVASVTPEVRAVALRMIELMRQADGVGLAAPQVGLPWRLFVAHVAPNAERSAEAVPPSATLKPFVYINPKLSSPIGAIESYEE